MISSDGEQIGVLSMRYGLLSNGVYTSVVAENNGYLDVSYWGVGSDLFEQLDI